MSSYRPDFPLFVEAFLERLWRAAAEGEGLSLGAEEVRNLAEAFRWMRITT